MGASQNSYKPVYFYMLLTKVVQKLIRHPLARVPFPNAERMEYFARQIHQCEPEVDDVIGFMDGLSLTSECASEMLEQNSMYNGYHSNTMVNNLIAYDPDGKVLCAVNFPSSWHDGSITANILPYNCKIIGSYTLCVNQGFPRSRDTALILVGSISCRQDQQLTTNLRAYLIKISNVYISL
jgi:hypothetical protein